MFSRCFQVLWDDDPNQELKEIGPALHFIEDTKNMNQKVLVQRGGRSASLIIAYLMKFQKLSLPNAIQKTQAERPLANPYSGFMVQLQELQSYYLSQHTTH